MKNISILNNLHLSIYLSKNKKEKKRAAELLEQVGLGNKINAKPNNLSQGEQQRAAIALAVVKNPSLILADEPTSSLDDVNCKNNKVTKRSSDINKGPINNCNTRQKIKRSV